MSSKTNLKLNLGCGADYKKGWVNIDAVADVKPDLVHDLAQPLPFIDASVQEVLAQDILEHFTWEDAHLVVAELGRVVQLNGQVTVRVPNIEVIIEQFANEPEVRNEFLYGTTKHTGVFGAHKVGYTPVRLAALFLVNGFELTSLQTVQTNWLAVFTKKIKHPAEFLAAGLQTIVVCETLWAKVFVSWWAWLNDKPVVWIENIDLSAQPTWKYLVSKMLYKLVKHLPLLILMPSVAVLEKSLVKARLSLAKCRVVSSVHNKVKVNSPQYKQAIQWAYCLHSAQKRVNEIRYYV